MRRIAVLVLIVGLAACGDDDEPTATATTPTTEAAPAGAGGTEQVVVEMAGFAFAPREIEVAVGQPVVWTNADEFAHTAQADDDGFDTGNIEPGASSDPVSFDEPGTYSYFCGIHNSMTGTVTVTG